MIKPNPFTPQSGWEPKVFGGRNRQLDRFVESVEEAILGRPNHLVILGEWGIGKTSLLKQFKKIAQANGHLAALCPITKFTERILRRWDRAYPPGDLERLSNLGH